MAKIKEMFLAIYMKSIAIVCDKLKKQKKGDDYMEKTQNHLQLPNVVSRDDFRSLFVTTD